MVRLALTCALVFTGLAAADVAPDYPLTRNSYRFELASAEGFDAKGTNLLVVTTTEGRREPSRKVKVQRAGEAPLSVPSSHWSQKVTHELLLVKGELPESLDEDTLKSLKVLAKVDLSRSLSGRERAKDDNRDYWQQVYTLVVTPKLKGDALSMTASKTRVQRKDRDGKVLSDETLKARKVSRVLNRPGRDALALGALLGLLGLGGLTLLRRKDDDA